VGPFAAIVVQRLLGRFEVAFVQQVATDHGAWKFENKKMLF
jgi:hypothetical protein